MSLFGEDTEVEFADETALSLDGVAGDNVTKLEPRFNSFILGHEAQENAILQLYHSEKMPHAVIFSGAEGIGKLTFAYRLARFLLSQEKQDIGQNALFGMPEPEIAKTLEIDANHPVFHRISSNGHSDFIVIDRLYDETKGRKKEAVEVAEIRKVAPFLRKTAAEGGWRVVIINDADTMNRNAQNAILKILEEPPEKTLLILVAHRAGALIPTIRSRARVINFQPLRLECFQSLMVRHGHNLGDMEIKALYMLSEASIGNSLELVEQGGLDVLGKVIALFQDYPNWRYSQIHVVAEDLARSSNVQGFYQFQKVMLWIIRQLVQTKARNGELPNGPLSALDLFATMLNKFTLEDLMHIYDVLHEHFDVVNRGNLEKRQAVLRAFSIISSEKG